MPAKAKTPAPATAPPPRTKGRLTITSLRAGAAPYAWGPADRRTGQRQVITFLTESATACSLNATAKVAGGEGGAEQIRWRVTPPVGFAVPVGADLTGSELSVQLVRAAGKPAVGAPLSLSVEASVTADGQTLADTAAVAQDQRDQMRQEYVDLARRIVPTRGELIDAVEFQRRYAKRYPATSFEQINWSINPATRQRYGYVMISERLLQAIQGTSIRYGRPVQITSGFRNPRRQEEVHGVVEESHHQYGRAADLYAVPDWAEPRTGRAITTEADWLRLAAAAVDGGAAWIEPMLLCNVNTAGCHVHLDVRESGSRAVKVAIRGQVRDGRTGRPAPGAVVTLEGMPATCNENGRFLLRHVLVPKTYPLKIALPDREPYEVSLDVRPNGPAELALNVPADGRGYLYASARDIRPQGDDEAVVTLAVRNIGPQPVRGVELQMASAGPVQLRQVNPATVPALGPFEHAEVTVTVRGDVSDVVPVSLRAAYQHPDGKARVQMLGFAYEPPHREAKIESPVFPFSTADEASAVPLPHERWPSNLVAAGTALLALLTALVLRARFSTHAVAASLRTHADFRS